MKIRFQSIVFSVLFLAAAFLTGLPKQALGGADQGKSAEEQMTGETATQQRESFKAKKEEHKKTAQDKLAGIEKKIDELETEAKKAGSKVRDDAKKGLKELKQKIAVLKNDLKRLEAAGKKKWEIMKKKVDDGLEDLEKTYNNVRDYFRSE